MANASLKFIHLSDIHFKKAESAIFENIRNELEREAQRTTHQIGPIDGILITGDVAFSGRSEEYEIARKWLDKLCGLTGCSAESVWTVPGNHDVERGVIRDSQLIQTIHQYIRSAGSTGLDKCLYNYLRDNEACELMYRPIRNYVSEFAIKYDCGISAKEPYVKHDFELNDSSVLRIRGVNSTIVSFDKDSEGDQKLVVGVYQSNIIQEDGVEYLLMCHHPYPWLIDYDALKDHWLARAKIQLFGHKHRPRLEELNKCLVMSAGAMQPGQGEPDWTPIFNFLDIAVLGEGDHRLLNVKVSPRNWNEAGQEFKPEYSADGKDYKEYDLPIKEWAGKQPQNNPKDAGETQVNSVDKLDDKGKKDEKSKNTAEGFSPRRLTYRFLCLPYHIRISIVNKLGLLQDEDKDLQDSELFPRFFKRAAESNKLQELATEVETAHKYLETQTISTL